MAVAVGAGRPPPAAARARPDLVRNAVFLAAAGVAAILVLYPLAMLVASSVTPGRPIEGAEPGPLAGYLLLFREIGLVRNSVTIAIGATAVALAVGVSLSWILSRADIPFRGLLEQLVTVPFYLSPLLGALGWIVLAAPGKAGLVNHALMALFGLSESPFDIYTPAGIIWVMGIFFTPFCFLIVSAALRSMDPSLEESSRVLGGKQFVTVTGRAYQPRLVDVGGWRYALLAIPVLYVLVTVVLPLGVMLWASLLRWTTFDIAQARFTLVNYWFILTKYPITLIAIRNSLTIALVGATVTMALSVIVAWMLQRSRIPGVRALEYVAMVPLSVPPMVFSIGLLWAWISFPLLPIYGTLWILILCNVTILLPYGVRSMAATMVQLDRSLEECAQVMGARWGRVLATVTLPLLAPGFLAGWTLVFVATLNELAAMALLVTSKTTVLSVAVYDLFNQHTYPNVAVLALIQATIVIAVLVAARAVGRRYGVSPP